MWQPSANIDALQKRAELIRSVRAFFESRNVMEVQTPVLSARSSTDVYIEPMRVANTLNGPQTSPFYLQTSPEFMMKRLLAAGSGSIFQIAHAFRSGEAGSRHNPEFFMLEWYRVGWDHRALMDEVDQFLQDILKAPPADYFSYREMFKKQVNLDPFVATDEALRNAVSVHTTLSEKAQENLDRNDCLYLLFEQKVESQFDWDTPVVIFDFPKTQAMLSRLRNEDDVEYAERFEVYYKGYELANGFHELKDAQEQAARFAADRETRAKKGLCDYPMDDRLIAALDAGLPDCAGVAIGMDRLAMIYLGVNDIRDVLAFDITRA